IVERRVVARSARVAQQQRRRASDQRQLGLYWRRRWLPVRFRQENGEGSMARQYSLRIHGKSDDIPNPLGQTVHRDRNRHGSRQRLSRVQPLILCAFVSLWLIPSLSAQQ